MATGVWRMCVLVIWKLSLWGLPVSHPTMHRWIPLTCGESGKGWLTSGFPWAPWEQLCARLLKKSWIAAQAAALAVTGIVITSFFFSFFFFNSHRPFTISLSSSFFLSTPWFFSRVCAYFFSPVCLVLVFFSPKYLGTTPCGSSTCDPLREAQKRKYRKPKVERVALLFRPFPVPTHLHGGIWLWSDGFRRRGREAASTQFQVHVFHFFLSTRVHGCDNIRQNV